MYLSSALKLDGSRRNIAVGPATLRRNLFPGLITTVTIVTLGIALSACSSDHQKTVSQYPIDYRERHPIVLANADKTIDIFVTSANGLDSRQRQELTIFARDYRQTSKSGVLIKVPVNADGSSPSAVKNTVRQVRQMLLSTGIRNTMIRGQAYYQPMSGSMPIKVSFVKLEAKVASQCGQWPTDLAGGDTIKDWDNLSYWNFGCSTQQTLAAQVADPIDLVRGRPEGRMDTVKRMIGIQKLRMGTDPSTQYSKQGGTIGELGSK